MAADECSVLRSNTTLKCGHVLLDARFAEAQIGEQSRLLSPHRACNEATRRSQCFQLAETMFETI